MCVCACGCTWTRPHGHRCRRYNSSFGVSIALSRRMFTAACCACAAQPAQFPHSQKIRAVVPVVSPVPFHSSHQQLRLWCPFVALLLPITGQFQHVLRQGLSCYVACFSECWDLGCPCICTWFHASRRLQTLLALDKFGRAVKTIASHTRTHTAWFVTCCSVLREMCGSLNATKSHEHHTDRMNSGGFLSIL